MEETQALPHLRETLLFLALAGVLVPFLQRLRMGSVPGFLAVGMLVGPFGLGRLASDSTAFGRLVGWFSFPQIEAVSVLSSIGVMFLLFMIGLELSTRRLWAMRHWVFAGGGAQVVVTTALLAIAGAAAGLPGDAALVAGLVLSFSSTAVVMQLLAGRRELGTPVGQASFAVLLFQDLAVVPALILVSLLGRPGDASIAQALALAMLKALVAIAVIFALGRIVIGPLFRRFAANRAADTFMALTLLSSLGIASLTWLAGLSMALGALLAGLLLAETEYRHQIEVMVDPFRGLLMGLFFLSVGMALDPMEILRQPFELLGAVVALFVLKALVLAIVMRMGGLRWRRALEAALLLGQGGEFGFVVVGAAMGIGLLGGEVGRFMMLVVGLSMFATPWVAEAGRRVAARFEPPARSVQDEIDESAAEGVSGHVIVAGFGRVGRLLCAMFEASGIRYVAIDPDARIVSSFHARGLPVFVGDATRIDLLERLGLRRASAVVLTMDQPAAAVYAVSCVRRDWPDATILARARDERHAAALREAGADRVVPETLESALQLAALALERAGLADSVIDAMLEREREQRVASYLGTGRREVVE